MSIMWASAQNIQRDFTFKTGEIDVGICTVQGATHNEYIIPTHIWGVIF